MVATHLNHLIGQFSAELFGRQEAQQLDRVTQEMPKLTEDRAGRADVNHAAQGAAKPARGKVPIRDMRTIPKPLPSMRRCRAIRTS